MSNGQPAFGNFIGQWHKKFMWLPIKTYDDRIVWLRYVWRRRVLLHDYLPNPYPHLDKWWWHQIEMPEGCTFEFSDRK